jgi:hypothetical protein
MADVRDAVKAVQGYVEGLRDILPPSPLRLEEFEYDADAGRWLITMSFDDPIALNRVYKTFVVSDEGRVEAMRIRNPLMRERV